MNHVFISHSTQNAEIASKVCWALERSGATAWMAPRDVSAGSSYPREIVQAIRDACVLVLVLSTTSNGSRHVHREVERAAAADVPIVVFCVEKVDLAQELEYFVSMNQWLDTTDQPLDRALTSLCERVGELHDPPLSGMGGAIEPAGSLQSSMPLSDEDVTLAVGFTELVDRHKKLLGDFGKEVVDFLCRRPDPTLPLPRRELHKTLRRARGSLFDAVTFRQFSTLLDEARLNGCCPGLVESDLGVAVVEETLTTKLERNRILKAELGRFAAGLVEPGQWVAMDGGSTTLPIVENLCEQLREEELYDLTIVTNSLAICNSFGQLILENGWSDSECPLRVITAGGHLRPTTLAVAATEDKVRELLRDALGQADRRSIDVAFVGGNGFTARAGITMGSAEELGVKRAFLGAAAFACVVADVTKFGTELPVNIVRWDEDFVLITNALTEPEHAELMQYSARGQIIEVPG